MSWELKYYMFFLELNCPKPNIIIILNLIPLYCCRVVFFNFRLMRVFPHESFLDFLLVVGGIARWDETLVYCCLALFAPEPVEQDTCRQVGQDTYLRTVVFHAGLHCLRLLQNHQNISSHPFQVLKHSMYLNRNPTYWFKALVAQLVCCNSGTGLRIVDLWLLSLTTCPCALIHVGNCNFGGV